MIILPNGSGITIIIQVTSRCQLNCSYCISPKGNADISPELIDQTFAALARLLPPERQLLFVWHGGEPLLRGLDFFKWAYTIQQKVFTNRSYRNVLQTNGLLLNNPFLNFVRQQKGTFVNISMDGPDVITRVSRGIEVEHYDALFSRVHASGIPFGVSIVATEAVLRYKNNVLAYFQDRNIHRIGLVPLIVAADTQGALPPPQLLADLALNLDEISQEVCTDVTPLGRLIIYGVLGQLIGLGCTLSSFSGGCHRRVICVSPDGGVYPCPRAQTVGLWKYGTVPNGGLENWWSSTSGSAPFRPRVPTECTQCRWVDLCNGGCPANALSMNGGREKRDYYCESFLHIFEYSAKIVQRNLVSLAGLKN